MQRILTSLAALVLGAFLSQAAQAEDVEVSVWVHQHPPLVKWLTEEAQAFDAENPGTHVEITAFPAPEMRTKVFTGLASGSGPTIFDLFAGDFPNVVSRDVAAPVDWEAMGFESADAFAATWMPGAIKAASANGQYYAIPFLGNPFSLFINRKYFEEAGLDPVADAPKNWDELAEVAAKLTVRDGNRFVQRGFDLPFVQGPAWWSNMFAMMIRQYGGHVLSADGKSAMVNSEAGVKALTTLYDLVYKYKVTAPGVGTATAVSPNQDFIDGNTAMWISGNWAIGTFPPDSEIMKTYAVVPNLQVDANNPHSIISGWWWYVAKNASDDQRREAWRFLQFISKPGEQLAATGLLMPNKAIIDSAQWKAFPYHEAFQKDLNAGEWTYFSLKYPEIEAEIASAMERSLVSGEDPKASLDEAEANINRILAQ